MTFQKRFLQGKIGLIQTRAGRIVEDSSGSFPAGCEGWGLTGVEGIRWRARR